MKIVIVEKGKFNVEKEAQQKRDREAVEQGLLKPEDLFFLNLKDFPDVRLVKPPLDEDERNLDEGKS